MRPLPPLLVVAAPVALLALAACGDASTVSQATTPGALVANGTVVYVVDGDTVDIEIGGTEERVRLIGIDTPETKKEDTPVECFGPEASARTAALLPVGTPVYVQRDVEPRDRYDRLLAYVYRADDGVFVNLALVADGYAQPLTIPPNVAHAEEFVAAARAAESADLGLWGGCSG